MKTKKGKTVRTEAEIEKEIERLTKDSDNFCGDNYGSEASDNGEFEVYFSQWKSGETLKNFVKWLSKSE